MAIEVELDMFSGRPNPRWELDADSEVKLLSYMQSLPPASEEEVSEPPPLGYRGFIIKSGQLSKIPGFIRIFKGTVRSDEKILKDSGYELENWLLINSGDALEEGLKTVVSREIIDK